MRVNILAAGIIAASLLSTSAHAAGPVTPSQFDKMFFFSLEGSYAMPFGETPDFVIEPQFNTVFTAPVGNGGRIAARVGVVISNQWDMALGGSLMSFAGAPGNLGLTSTTSAQAYSIDVEAGYTPTLDGNGTVRLFGGLRFAHWHDFTDVPCCGAGTPGSATIDAWGIGPRVGIEASHKLGDTPLSLFGSASAAYLFGRLDETGSFTTFPPPIQHIGNNIANAEAKLGISDEIAPGVSLGAGYRVDLWSGVTLESATGTFGGPGDGEGSRLSSGPFVTLSGRM